jgi:hypothetical protein
MTDLKIKLPEPEDINRQITDAIAKSVIGEKLKEAVEAEVLKLSSTYNNPIQKIVEDEVRKLLYQIVRDEYGEVLRTKIREALTDELLNDLVFRALDAYTASRYK